MTDLRFPVVYSQLSCQLNTYSKMSIAGHKIACVSSPSDFGLLGQPSVVEDVRFNDWFFIRRFGAPLNGSTMIKPCNTTVNQKVYLEP